MKLLQKNERKNEERKKKRENVKSERKNMEKKAERENGRQNIHIRNSHSLADCGAVLVTH